jgi:uncharacterized protein (DUF362 family)
MKDVKCVSIVRSGYDHVYTNLRKAIHLSGGLHVRDHESVVIKINLCDFRTPETGAITHPIFLEAVLRYLRENYQGLKIYVVESDATVARPDLFIRWFGFLPILQKWGAVWCNLSKEKTVTKNINGLYFQKLDVPQIFEDSYCITLPKMKTSSITKISCALKNQFGCIPTRRKIVFHPKIDDVIVDANLAMRPNFCIVDGIIGMGGSQGPAFGVPLPAHVIVAGGDPVAVDTVCARIMGFNPFFIGHIQKAAKSNLGSTRYKILGNQIKKVKANFRWSILEAFVIKIGEYLQSRVK